MITINARPMAQIKRDLKAFGVGSLLSISSDSKTKKGEKSGYVTGIVYMLPNSRICPASKAAACHEPCLVSAGRGRFNSVKTARQNRTRLYQEATTLFYEALIAEIKAARKKHGKALVVRLNGTSDIAHERQPIMFNGVVYDSIFHIFSGIQFYDYTKRFNRISDLPPNYDLTLSYSGARATYAAQVLSKASQTRVAVVFSDLGKALKDKEFYGLPVIDGDSSDLRFLEPKQRVIVGLQAKGKAKADYSGFVVRNSASNSLIAKG